MCEANSRRHYRPSELCRPVSWMVHRIGGSSLTLHNFFNGGLDYFLLLHRCLKIDFSFICFSFLAAFVLSIFQPLGPVLSASLLLCFSVLLLFCFLCFFFSASLPLPFFANRGGCMRFLSLRRGTMARRHNFAYVSGLAFSQWGDGTLLLLVWHLCPSCLHL